MDCPCGCQEKMPEAVASDLIDSGLALDAAITAVRVAMEAAWEEGFREGARTMIDTTESVINFEDEIENLVEADAVALDSVLARIQDIALRLDALELEIGVKYLG